MKQVGIVAYLNDLARRYNEMAKASSDFNTSFELTSLSIELFSKAFSLAEAFTIPEKRHRVFVGPKDF
jgi:hypothetical protein